MQGLRSLHGRMSYQDNRRQNEFRQQQGISAGDAQGTGWLHGLRQLRSDVSRLGYHRTQAHP